MLILVVKSKAIKTGLTMAGWKVGMTGMELDGHKENKLEMRYNKGNHINYPGVYTYDIVEDIL